MISNNSLKKIIQYTSADVDSITTPTTSSVVFVSDKVAVVVYTDMATAIYAKVVTIGSDGTCTLGPRLTVYSGASSIAPSVCYSPTEGKVSVVYTKVNSFYTGLFSVALTVSGTSVTASAENTLQSLATQTITKLSSCYDPVAGKTHIAYTRYNAGYKTYIRTISGSTFSTQSTETRLGTGAQYTVNMCYDTNSSKLIISYTDSTPNFYVVSASYSAGTYSFGTTNQGFGTVGVINGLVFNSKRNIAVQSFYDDKTGYGSVIPISISGTSMVLGTKLNINSAHVYSSITYNPMSSRVLLYQSKTSAPASKVS